MSKKGTEQNKESLPCRPWTIDEEIRLFSLVCDYKPAGPKKQENMAIIISKINEDIQPQETPLTESDVWKKLQQLYNLPRIDLLEGLNSDDVANNDSLENISDNTTVREEIIETELDRTRQSAKGKDENDDEEDDGDETNKIEGDDVEPEKNIKTESTTKGRRAKGGHESSTRRRLRNSVDNDSVVGDDNQTFSKVRDSIKDESEETQLGAVPSKNVDTNVKAEVSKQKSREEDEVVEEEGSDTAPARRTRGRRHIADHDVVSTEPPRKKLRSVVKDEDSLDEARIELPTKKGKPATSVSAQPPLARRRTRSEAHIEHTEEADPSAKRETKRRVTKAADLEDESEEDLHDKKKLVKLEKKSDKTHRDAIELTKSTVRRSSRGANTSQIPSRLTPPVRRSTRKK